MLLATVWRLASSWAVSSLPVKTTIGMSPRLGSELFEELEAAHVGQAEIDDAAVVVKVAQRL